MPLLDWFFALMPLLVVAIAGAYARRYVKSVADFISGNRSAGRYLLAIAGGELQTGAAIFVAAFEVTSRAGFTYAWWGWLTIPIGLIVRISGFVVYRYRETRALTLAQFFELRYDKSFRILTGLLAFLAGIFNFGIIPAIGARCVVYLLGFPETVVLAGHHVPCYVPLMAIFLVVTVFVATSGGILTVMIVNCVEGIISQISYLVIIAALLSMFKWSQIATALSMRPPGQSLLNPFDTFGLQDFNLSFVLMGIVVGIYSTMAWQNSAGYNSAAWTPHEGRMGNVLSNWREMGKSAVAGLLGVCAITYLHHPDFAAQAAHVRDAVGQIADSQARAQMEMPIGVAHMLPVGAKGIFAAILLMGIFGGDATHMHSWGSIFVQDVLVPLRKKPFTPERHLFVLRCSIVGVAVFAFAFGVSFHQTEYVLIWWAVTQAIFTGGAGAAIIGGLYWKKGTSQAAWAGFITGSFLSTAGVIARQVYGNHFPLNGLQIAFCATLAAGATYVVVSLLSCKEDFNMDRLLHRGEYAVIQPLLSEPEVPLADKRVWLGRLIGLDEHFTVGDRWIAGGVFGWSMIYFAIFVVGTIWNLIVPWPLTVWISFWHVFAIVIPITLAVVTGVWFTWGGIRDIRQIFQRLAVRQISDLDDGTVVANQNLDELILKDQIHGSHAHDAHGPDDQDPNRS